jgi:hypothetical protein
MELQEQHWFILDYFCFLSGLDVIRVLLALSFLDKEVDAVSVLFFS